MNNKLYWQWRFLEWTSLIGDSLYYLALLSYASKISNPALAVMIITFSETIPNFFQILLGVVADSTLERTKRFFQSGVVRGMIYLIIGLIIFKTNSIYGIIVIGVLNSFSDVFGRYATLCMDPFIKFIIPENIIEKALSINFAVTSSLGMIANFLGVAIISLTGIYQLAFINSLTFFIVSVGIKLITPELEQIEKKIKSKKHNNLKQIFNHIKESLKELLDLPQMRIFFFIAAGLNSVAVTVIPVVTIVLSHDESNVLMNIPFSIAFIQAAITLSGILGSWLGARKLKSMSTKSILLLSFTANLFFVILIYTNQLWLGVFVLQISIFVTSIFNLKFSSDIIRTIPAEKMGTIYGCMDTFFLVVPSLISMIFMTLATIDLRIYTAVIVVFCLFFIIVILKNKQYLQLKIIN